MSATSVIGVGLRALLARRAKALSDTRRFAADTGAIQRAQLRSLLRAAQATDIGRECNFAALASEPDDRLVQAYRAAVPIAAYDALLPRLRRMREGAEPGVTWPGAVMDWAQTSGTTAGDKYVPVSAALLRHHRKAALDIFAHLMRWGESMPGIFGGRLFFLGGSTDLSVSERGIRTGDLSGIVTPLIRWPVTAAYLPGKDVALLSDWTTKIDRMAEAGLEADVRFVSGMPSWTLVLAEKMLELARSRGRRADCLRDIWPNFRVFVHGGVKFTPFEPRVREIWSGSSSGPDIPVRYEVYPASEGFVAMQDTLGDPGLRLNIDHGIFYEFVPVEEIHGASPRAFTADRVEKGRRYVVVMSTPGGLWRYILGDVVEFDTVPPEGPARLRIVGRHRLFVNAFGENLIVEHIENAVVAAAKAAGVTVGEFTAAPVYPVEGRRAGLELAIEWIAGPAEAKSAFVLAFDDSLKSQNADYTTKRGGDLGMAPPTLTLLAPGAFHRWMQRRGKLGGQHKCPRCANNREILESVLAPGERPPEITVPAAKALGPAHAQTIPSGKESS